MKGEDLRIEGERPSAMIAPESKSFGLLIENECSRIKTVIEMLRDQWRDVTDRRYDDFVDQHGGDVREQAVLCGMVRKLKDEVEGLLEDVNKLHQRQITKDMIAAFKAHNATLPMAKRIRSLSIGMGRFTLTQRKTWTVVNKEKAYAWLKKVKLGALVQPYVHPSTLSAAVNEYAKETGKEPTPDVMKPQPHTQISIHFAKETPEQDNG